MEMSNNDVIMPFGKFKGTDIEDVPDRYLLYLHQNADSRYRQVYPEVFSYIEENLDAIKLNIEKQSNNGHYGT